MQKHYPKGLDNRMEDRNGRIREKRGDTNVGTIEDEYDRDFGVRSDMHLSTLLELTGNDSLNQLLRNS